MGKSILLTFLLVLVLSPFYGQEGGNPFELPERLEEVKKASPVNTITNDNPFEKVNPQNYSNSETPELPQLPSIQPQVQLQGAGWFWIMLFITLIAAVLINLNRTLLLNLGKAWSNINFGNLLWRDQKDSDQLQYISLGIVFYLNLGIFIILLGEHLLNIPSTWSNLAKVTGIICLVYLVRHAILRLLSVTFSIAKEAGQYSFTINIFNVINGLILLIMNFFIAFGPDALAPILIQIVAGFLIIQFIYRSIRGLLLTAKYIAQDQIHFLLYLCTCEIAPIVVGAVYLSELT